jgi:ABC-2 type transport system ATP-binding protein
MCIELEQPVEAIPVSLSAWPLELLSDGKQLSYTYDPKEEHTGIADLLDAIRETHLVIKDISTSQSSLEEIFVSLVKDKS